MARLLKFLPVVVTMVTKFLRSPRGKALVHKMRSSRTPAKTVRNPRRKF